MRKVELAISLVGPVQSLQSKPDDKGLSENDFRSLNGRKQGDSWDTMPIYSACQIVEIEKL